MTQVLLAWGKKRTGETELDQEFTNENDLAPKGQFLETFLGVTTGGC